MLTAVIVPANIRNDYTLSGQEKEFLSLLNDERAKLGVAPLVLNDKLQLAADMHTKNMQRYNYLAHIYYNADTDTWIPFYELYAMCGWSGRTSSECALRAASCSAADALFLFKSSAGHWNALTLSIYDVVGVSRQSSYWCITLGGQLVMPYDMEYGRTRLGSLVSRDGRKIHLEILTTEEMVVAGNILNVLASKNVPFTMVSKKVYSPFARGYVYGVVIDFISPQDYLPQMKSLIPPFNNLAKK